MPRIPLSITTPSDVQVGLWRMDESEDEILHANPSLYSLLPDIKGMNKRSLEIARKMLANGMDVAMVMEITGLSESQLQQLKG